LVNYTGHVEEDNRRWDAAEWLLSVDGAVTRPDFDRPLPRYDAGRDPRVMAIHSALVDFIMKLNHATAEETSGDRHNELDDPRREVLDSADWLRSFAASKASPARRAGCRRRPYTRNMDAHGRLAIGFALASNVCLWGALGVLGSHARSWSKALTALCWFSVAGAIVFGVVGIVLALSSSLPPDQRRVWALMSLPGILAPVWLLIAYAGLGSQMR
jgi:hypothetical protein